MFIFNGESYGKNSTFAGVLNTLLLLKNRREGYPSEQLYLDRY